MERGKTLLIGVVIGAIGVGIYGRVWALRAKRNPKRLIRELSKQIDALDAMIESGRIAAPKQ